MARITVEDCLQKIPNRFQLVLAATYRARMLSHHDWNKSMQRLDRILEAGRRTPSSRNEQRWAFVVVRDDGPTEILRPPISEAGSPCSVNTTMSSRVTASAVAVKAPMGSLIGQMLGRSVRRTSGPRCTRRWKRHLPRPSRMRKWP